ncbi:MAG: ribonuclease HII, partial [Aggregatilineales bacterium]
MNDNPPTPKKKKAPRKERSASLKFENDYFKAGYQHIAGMDEAGRGPWAGDVYAAVVALPLSRKNLTKMLKGVKDSKDMTASQREESAEKIKEVALAWGIGNATPQEIAEYNLNVATRMAMRRALDDANTRFDFTPDCLFLDYMPFPELRQMHVLSLVKGDKKSLSIAAASVLAKTIRDASMVALAEDCPDYGF